MGEPRRDDARRSGRLQSVPVLRFPDQPRGIRAAPCRAPAGRASISGSRTRDGALLGAVPCYAKSHSQGEYVFDHGWADAFERAGGSYYPKLQVVGPVHAGDRAAPARRERRRRSDVTKAALAAGLKAVTERLGVSSAHVTFATERRRRRARRGRLPAAAPTSSSISSTRAMAATAISSTRSPRASARR